MHGYPLPPVPKKLQEMLADYPDLIERLQQVLNSSAERSRRLPLMPFDDAISALDGRLSTFLYEARDELASAEEIGDQVLIGTAKRKKSAVAMAGLSQIWITDSDFCSFFFTSFR